MYLFSYPKQEDEERYDFDVARERIHRLKAHLLRAVNQDQAKIDILEQLIPMQGLVSVDLAMKYLPCKFREAQQNWFGEKSVSWHVTAVVTKAINDEFQVRQ